MPATLNEAGLFLITILFDLYLFVLSARLLLFWVKADYFNPITHFVIRLTDPIITKLRRVLPNHRNLETSTLILILFLELSKLLLISLLFDAIPDIGMTAFVFLTLTNTLKLILGTFFYAILFHAILSWIQPGYSPISQILSQLSAPILRPLQRAIPPVAGFDLTPLFALILLQFIMILL